MMLRNPLLILGFSAFLLTACDSKEQEKPPVVRPVLSVIAKNDANISLTAAGTIEPQFTTELGFKVLGRVIARNVNVGDQVKKGEVVAAIDSLSLELAVKSAEADVSNALAQQANAASTEQRQRSLAQSRSGTEAAVEQAEEALKTANANVAKAQANLKKAREELDDAQLHAEFDGVVTATNAEVGQIVSAGQSVVTIARPDVREAVVDIPEGIIGQLTTGAAFQVSLQLDPKITNKAVVREIAPVADSTTRTKRVKMTLADPPDAFRLGSVVTATTKAKGDPAITLPASALLQKDGTFVWIVDEQAGKVTRREVRVLSPAPDATTIKVLEGVKDGERVVVAGVNQLTDGQSIRIDERNSL